MKREWREEERMARSIAAVSLLTEKNKAKEWNDASMARNSLK
jgi:hypothetical protein